MERGWSKNCEVYEVTYRESILANYVLMSEHVSIFVLLEQRLSPGSVLGMEQNRQSDRRALNRSSVQCNSEIYV